MTVELVLVGAGCLLWAEKPLEALRYGAARLNARIRRLTAELRA
jgi:hypothetical protein